MISDFRAPNIKKSDIISDLLGRIFPPTRQLYKSSIPLYSLSRRERGGVREILYLPS